MNFGELRSISEINSVIKSQWKNGMLPSIRFVPGMNGYSPDQEEWGVDNEISGCYHQGTSGITQPPILGYSLLKALNISDNQSDFIIEIEKFYEPVKKYHDFLLRERDPHHEFLLSIIHPWESGTDNSPYFDEPLERTYDFLREKKYSQRIRKRKDTIAVSKDFRPLDVDYDCYGRLIDLFIKNNYQQAKIIDTSKFVVQDVLFNSIFAASVKSLSELSNRFYNERIFKNKKSYYYDEYLRNEEIYNKIKNAINRKFFNPKNGLYYSYDLFTNQHLNIDTIHCLCPFFGNIASVEQANLLIDHLLNPNEFGTELPIPTVSAGEVTFDSFRYWRGPVWPVTNWIITEGLKFYNPSIANYLRKIILNMIEEGKNISREKALELAKHIMNFNSYKDLYTTPSRKQYVHGWLWDSCIAATAWVHVLEKPSDRKLYNYIVKYNDLLKDKKFIQKGYQPFLDGSDFILFYEYFTPRREGKIVAGTPLGSHLMTWTASVYIDVLMDQVGY